MWRVCILDGSNWHMIRLPWMTHPTVALQEKITALPVPIGVRGLVDHFEDRLPRNKTIHPFWFINLIWTVVVEEFPYRQRPGTIWHDSVQDLHRYEDPLGVWGYLADGKAQVLKEFAIKGVQGKPKTCLEHLFIHSYTVYPFIVTFFQLIR